MVEGMQRSLRQTGKCSCLRTTTSVPCLWEAYRSTYGRLRPCYQWPLKADSLRMQKCGTPKEMTAVIYYLQNWRRYLLGTRFLVRIDNAGNTLFKTQKKLSPKQVRGQECPEEFDFVWKHKPGRQNLVPDALSRRCTEVVAAINMLESQFLPLIKEEWQKNSVYEKLRQRVKNGLVRSYWLEDELLYAKGRRLYIPNSGGLRWELVRETHDSRWAGHPGRERTLHCWRVNTSGRRWKNT